MAVIVDTGIWLSAADSDEPSHGACAQVLRDHRGELIIPAPVIPETAWLIESRLGPAAEARFIRLVTARECEIIELDIAGYERCVELVETYSDLGLGFVDASVVTVAEQRGVTMIATLNRRDFAVVRPQHCEAFELIP